MASRSGAARTLAIGPNVTTPTYTDLSGIDNGLGAVGVTREALPGASQSSAGQGTTELSGHFRNSIAYTMEENSLSVAQFWGKNGLRRKMRERKRGDGAGLPEREGVAILTVSFELRGNSGGQFSITGTFDGGFPEVTQ